MVLVIRNNPFFEQALQTGSWSHPKTLPTFRSKPESLFLSPRRKVRFYYSNAIFDPKIKNLVSGLDFKANFDFDIEQIPEGFSSINAALPESFLA
jgi:hypothetical protein